LEVLLCGFAEKVVQDLKNEADLLEAYAEFTYQCYVMLIQNIYIYIYISGPWPGGAMGAYTPPARLKWSALLST